MSKRQDPTFIVAVKAMGLTIAFLASVLLLVAGAIVLFQTVSGIGCG